VRLQSSDAQSRAWARLKEDVNCGLRRGAWYRVVSLTADEVTVQVPRREQVRVPRKYVQTLFARPHNWTVVPAPRSSGDPPGHWRPRYAVCPVCRGRAPITGYARDLRCQRCNGLFGIAWEERYLTAG
jgi:hypothetical protein